MRKIDKIIIHCSATAEDKDFTEKDLEISHNRRGINSPMGYHRYYRKDGRIIEGRPIEQVGAHALGHNKYSIGVCYEGGLKAGGKGWKDSKDTRTKEQIGAMVRDIYGLWVKYGKPEIIGHNEVSNKQCPCFNVRKWIKKLNW